MDDTGCVLLAVAAMICVALVVSKLVDLAIALLT